MEQFDVEHDGGTARDGDAATHVAVAEAGRDDQPSTLTNAPGLEQGEHERIWYLVFGHCGVRG